MSSNQSHVNGLLIRAATQAVENYHLLLNEKAVPVSPPNSTTFQSSGAFSRGNTNTQSADSYENDTFQGGLAMLNEIATRLKRLLHISFFVGTLFLTCTILYGAMYWMIMPINYTKVPIYFDYISLSEDERLTCSESNPIHSEVIHPPSPSRCINYESPHSSILGTIDLFSRHTQWYPNPKITNEIQITPEPIIDNVLIPNKKYFLNVVLVLPESKINSDIGMFMVNVELYSSSSVSNQEKNRTLLGYSKRSAMLPYESPMVEFFRKFLFIGFFMTDVFPEAKSVEIKCIDHFIENELKPLSHVTIKIDLPRVGTTPIKEIANLQILSAELRIGEELNLIQLYMKEWFYSCAFIGIICLMIILSPSWFLLRLWWTSYRTKRMKRRKGIGQQKYARKRHSRATGDEHFEEEDEIFDEDASEIFMNMNVNEEDSENWEDLSEEGSGGNSEDSKPNEFEGKQEMDKEDEELSRDGKESVDEHNAYSKSKKGIPMKRKIVLKKGEKMRAEKILRGEREKIDTSKENDNKSNNEACDDDLEQSDELKSENGRKK